MISLSSGGFYWSKLGLHFIAVIVSSIPEVSSKLHAIVNTSYILSLLAVASKTVK